MGSALTQPRQIRSWQSDADYIRDQDENASWSSLDHNWGDAAASKFVAFGASLGNELCHDDAVADFGGNDGWAAWRFYMTHKIKPLVVDCEPKRLLHAKEVYKLPVLQTFIEDMPLPDKSIDWGFTSHTLEHTRDTPKAMREMARVIKRGCCFYLPLEDRKHADKNHSHAICIINPNGWHRLLEANGWRVDQTFRSHQSEVAFYAVPA